MMQKYFALYLDEHKTTISHPGSWIMIALYEDFLHQVTTKLDVSRF
jgi:hypothetical protein